MSEAVSIVVQVPSAIRRRSGRRAIVTPQGAAARVPTHTRADPALVKALARGHCWTRILEKGRYAPISEAAAAEKLDRGYLGCVLQLTLPVPDIVQAILDERQAGELGLPKLIRPFPVNWPGRRAVFADAAHQEPTRGVLN